MKVLISGAGIAGLTNAFWLAKSGFEVVVIERAAALRDEGYMMDFSAEGIQIAKAMGILDQLNETSQNLKEVAFVKPDGSPHGGFQFPDLQALMIEQKSGYMPLMRGDLERTLANALPETVTLRTSTTIARVNDREHDVEVEFADGTIEVFDYLIVAEGIHSHTRSLVFGPEEEFIRPLNSTVAIARFKDEAETAGRKVMTNINVGSFVITTPTVDGDTIAVFAFASQETPPGDQASAKSFLRAQFPKSNTFAQNVLDQITPETDLFMDQVAQIHNPSWCKGRVALIGDAASCMTLLSGQGSIMAMAQGYVLAHELATCRNDHKTAFENYEKALRAEIDDKMKIAAKVSVLIPESRVQLAIFKLVTRFMRFWFALRILFGVYLKPTIFNKGYPLNHHSKMQERT